MKRHTATNPVMQKRKLLNACLFLPAGIAVAADCDDFSSADFFQAATAQVVEECIQKGQIDINSRDENGVTPLHLAAGNGSMLTRQRIRAQAEKPR